MIDEIHLQPYMDYKGGNVVGASAKDSSLATAAHVFMIQSLLSPKKEVVHILPVRKLTSDGLYNVIISVIVGLESVGLTVISVV
jgi:hypothetical protein